MAWVHNGRKYWYHNGKRYSSKIKRRNRNSNGFFNVFSFDNKPNIEHKYSDKHSEAMEYRKKLLRENRNSNLSPTIFGSSIAITGTDDEVIEFMKRRNKRN